MREGTQTYPSLKSRVFVDDITPFINGRNKVLVKLAEKVLKKLNENCLKLSITEGGTEGKRKAITFCKYLEEWFQESSKKEEVALATSVETL